MAILIKFENPNVDEITLKIYRGTSELDRENLGVPIDTLVGRPTEYLDKTALQGNTYYYVFESIGNNDRDISRNIKIIAAESRGPGNNILREGTRDLGFYDMIPAADVLTAVELTARIGGSVGWTSTSSFTSWLKFARNGKVFFVPSSAMGRATSSVINTIGLYGEGKIIEQNGFKYKCRFARGFGETIEEAVAFLADKADGVVFDMDPLNITCEYNDLFYPIYNVIPLGQRLGNKTNIAPPSAMASGVNIVTLEQLSGGGITSRGTSTGTWLATATVGRWETALNKISAIWPILELIEE